MNEHYNLFIARDSQRSLRHKAKGRFLVKLLPEFGRLKIRRTQTLNSISKTETKIWPEIDFLKVSFGIRFGIS